MDDLISIGAYNLHGFNNGSILLPELCKSVDILAIEEHWLAPDNLYKIIIISNWRDISVSK